MGRTSARHDPIRIRIEAAPAYEFVLSLAVAASRADIPEANALRSAAGAPLVERVRRFAGSDWMWAHLLTLAYEAPAPRDLAEFLAFMHTVPPRELLRRLAGYYVRWFRRATPVATMDAALRGESAGIRQFVASGGNEDAEWSSSLRIRLEAGGAASKRELLPILDAWSEQVFAPVLAPASRRLIAAANARRRAMAGLAPHDALTRVLGWSYVPEPGVARVLLIPSAVTRPLTHEFEQEQTKLICFPVDPDRELAPRPPAALLALAQALADESRLRALRELSREELGAQQLADRLNLGLPTMLHHLAELRAVGLIERGGRRRPYRLAQQGLARAAGLLHELAR